MSSETPRQTYSEHEKGCLQKLILKYKLNSTATRSLSAKKLAWARLTQEFNSIETNSKRTEAQLRKCWDNLKTRRKQSLARAKRERMRTGGGLCTPSSSQVAIGADALKVPKIEPEYVLDSDADMAAIDQNMSAPVPTIAPTVSPASAATSNGAASSQIYEPIYEKPDNVELPYQPSAGSVSNPRNTGAREINEDFTLRKEQYQVAYERDEELHKLKVAQQQWLLKAAEETYQKARIERETAKEMLLCSQAKRELAEILLANAK